MNQTKQVCFPLLGARQFFLKWCLSESTTSSINIIKLSVDDAPISLTSKTIKL